MFSLFDLEHKKYVLKYPIDNVVDVMIMDDWLMDYAKLQQWDRGMLSANDVNRTIDLNNGGLMDNIAIQME